MRKGIRCIMFLMVVLFLASCSATQKEITIEPYELSDKEQALISKTGIGNIQYFILNGDLDADEDLRYTVELYEEGEFKTELFASFGTVHSTFEETIISFGVDVKDGITKLIMGTPSGLSTSDYQYEKRAYSFGPLLNEKVTLEKNTPIYLAGWQGTSKDILRSLSSESGELPDRLEDAEIALLYKVVLTEKE